MKTVLEIVNEIQTNRTQQSASGKDEVAVMRGMLNDTGYVVDVYNQQGKAGTYCPSEDARAMLANQLHKAAKVTSQEAGELAAAYEFTRSDAETHVRVAKEFVNTYIGTGRKLPLGCREESDVSLLQKNIPACERTYPKKTGVNADGTDRYEKATTQVPAHSSIRVISTCPAHKKA